MTYAIASINPLLRRPAPPFLPCPDAGAGQPDLRPPATGTDHRQPGAAPDQPVSLPPGRRVRRPELARQLRRQPDQGPAAITSGPGHGLRPDGGQRHLPRRLRGTRHPVHGLGHPPGLRRLRPEGFPAGGDVRFHLGTPALLAAETLCRRSPRPVTISPTLEHFLGRYGQFIRNCKPVPSNAAASWPS